MTELQHHRAGRSPYDDVEDLQGETDYGVQQEVPKPVRGAPGVDLVDLWAP